MQNQSGINSYRDFAKKFVTEYDMAVRRGFQTINNIPLSVDNKKSMEQLANLACSTSLTKKGPEQHTFIDDLGKAVVGYWTGASLMTGIPPIIPALGSFLNVTSVYATVTKPGIFPVVGPIPPTNDSNIFLDRLIGAMQQHATTIEGLYMTISLYPGFPLVPPAPGILFWTGWSIPPAKPSTPSTTQPVVSQPELPEQEKPVEQLLSEIKDDNNTLEAAGVAVANVGSVEFLSDEGQDAGTQIEEIKTKLAPVLPPTPPISDDVQEIDGTNELEGEAVECGVKLDYEENFTTDVRLRTLCLDCTFPHKIKEQRGLSVEDLVCNLKAVAENLVQPIKDKYPNVQINSGFRGTPSIPGGVSQHEKGEAIDIQFPGVTPLGYLPITEWIINNCAFDQIIFEHGKSIWLHISYKRTGTNRKKKLTMINGKYENGIKCYYDF